MAAVTISQMLAAEAAAFAAGWSEEQLLELAGTRLGRAIGRFFPTPGHVVAYLGKGHNAGDALVALRILRDEFNWRIFTRNAHSIEDCAQLTQRKWQELKIANPLERTPDRHGEGHPLILLDALLGSGGKGPIRDPLLTLSVEMERLRQSAGARVIAVDLPSGIDADSGEPFPGTVVADVTFMIGNAKRGLLSGRAANHVGALALVPIEALVSDQITDFELICPQTMTFGKSPRPFDFHKGMAGRVGILAGSEAYSGAAVLAATGALRAGGGLITLHVPHKTVSLISAKCPPEIMVSGFETPDELIDLNYNAWVIGCGIGTPNPSDSASLIKLIADIRVPAVVDADALNLIAAAKNTDILRENHVITPHPGEFSRLAPDLDRLSRETAARAFTDRCKSTLLLKGARTIVTRSGQALWCNATGTPGMATGGQGDLLAGVVGARLASGMAPIEAAAHAAWLCGRATEISQQGGGDSEESSTPTGTQHHLGSAFQDWRCSRR